jgi:hypothetical protein
MKRGAHALVLALVYGYGLVMAQPARFEGRGASISAPAGWTCNAPLLAAGGPIACANFAEPNATGGVLPPGGAEIEITSVARPMALDVYARGELRGVRDVKLQEAPVGGRPALRAAYTEQVAPGVSTDNQVYYVAQGNRLYKFYLTYHSGDAQAAALVRTWETVVREAVLK